MKLFDILLEIGEATLPIYPYKLKEKKEDLFHYIFSTEDNDNYYVKCHREVYNPENGASLWLVVFYPYNEYGNYIRGDTNRHRHFRIMSTITNILHKFINVAKPSIIHFYPDDARRGNMYIPYITKNLPQHYVFDEPDHIVLDTIYYGT